MAEMSSSNERMHFLRSITQGNIAQISIADNKAGIILAANFISISFFLGKLFQKDMSTLYFIPLFFSTLIILFAIQALLPKFISSKDMPMNYLFFGVIKNLTYSQYIQEMESILSESKEIYHAMLNDFFQTCFILDLKYKNLHRCYQLFYIFMITALAIMAVYFYQLFF